MCAIVDANVAREVFEPNQPPAGREFFRWLNKQKGRFVIGGKLREELRQSSANYRTWAQQARLSGLMTVVSDSEVNARTDELRSQAACGSNDEHVIALAQVSGTRLLYSNDRALQQDFRNKSIVDNPRGRIYTTHVSRAFSPTHRNLLNRKDLCRVER